MDNNKIINYIPFYDASAKMNGMFKGSILYSKN